MGGMGGIGVNIANEVCKYAEYKVPPPIVSSCLLFFQTILCNENRK